MHSPGTGHITTKPLDFSKDFFRIHRCLVEALKLARWNLEPGFSTFRCGAPTPPQEHAVQLHLHQDNLVDLVRRHNASEIPEVGLQAAATQLSEFFLTPDARR